MAYPSPRKTPRKRRNSGSSRTTKRARTSRTRGFRVRRVSKLVSARRKYRFRRTAPRFKINFPGGRAINVKEDKEGYTKTYHRQPVTAQQQKIINKRFKNGYSPFKDFIDSRFQLVTDAVYDKAKWVWRTVNTLSYIQKIWSTAPNPAGDQAPGTALTAGGDYYKNGPDQAVYLNAFKYRYEIYNPTNYDMNLVIYDIVYKTDTDYQAKNAWWENTSVYDNISNSDSQNPIPLINSGLSSTTARYSATGSATVSVADPNAKGIQDITTKPTESYPFNIYCKIVKKHTYRLQPGASMTHKFIHKPKCLLNRGYFYYKYVKNLLAQDTNTSGTAIEAKTRDIALKDITSGCLFKVWGCVTGTTTTTRNEVVNLTGKLMFKEYVESRWDVMDQKYTYVFKTTNDNYEPGSSMTKKFEVVTRDNIVLAEEVDADANNNATATTSTIPTQGNV